MPDSSLETFSHPHSSLVANPDGSGDDAPFRDHPRASILDDRNPRQALRHYVTLRSPRSEESASLHQMKSWYTVRSWIPSVEPLIVPAAPCRLQFSSSCSPLLLVTGEVINDVRVPCKRTIDVSLGASPKLEHHAELKTTHIVRWALGGVPVRKCVAAREVSRKTRAMPRKSM